MISSIVLGSLCCLGLAVLIIFSMASTPIPAGPQLPLGLGILGIIGLFTSLIMWLV